MDISLHLGLPHSWHSARPKFFTPHLESETQYNTNLRGHKREVVLKKSVIFSSRTSIYSKKQNYILLGFFKIGSMSEMCDSVSKHPGLDELCLA